MRILDRYVAREFAGPFALSVAAFIIIMLSGQLFWLMDLIVQKHVPVLTVMRMLLYSLPGIVTQVLPIAVLFAVMLGLGRLARDSELSTMRACGVPFARIVLPLVIIGALVSGFGFWLGDTVAPWASHESETIFREMIMQDAYPDVEQDVFFTAPGDRFVYIGKVHPSDGLMERIMVYETRYNSFPRMVVAASGRVSDQIWRLSDGSVYDIDSSGHVSSSMSFESLDINMDNTLDSVLSDQKTPQEMSRKELKQNIDLFERGGIKVSGLRVDYYLKVATPVAALVFAILGAPLVAKSPRRGGSYFGVVVASVLAFSYFIVQATARSYGARGAIPTFVAAWLPNILFAIPGVVMLFSVDRDRSRGRACAGRRKGGKRGLPTMIIGCAALAATLVAYAAAPVMAGSFPVTMKATRLTYVGDEGVWVASGSVEIEFKETRITGDRVELDTTRKTAVITGGVTVVTEDGELKGETVTYDLAADKVVVGDARAKLAGDGIEGYLYISGAEFETQHDYLRLSRGSVTTCDLDKPHYRIEAEQMEFWADDRIVLRKVSYYEGNVRLVTLPRLTIPLGKDERLELPEIGYGALEGWYIKTKYNYTINDDLYGSLYADYFQLLGPAAGVSQKIKLDRLGKLTLYAYGLWDIADERVLPTLEVTHEADLPGNISSKMGYKYKDSLALGRVESVERTYTLSLDRRVEGASTSASCSLRTVDSTVDSSYTTASFRHSGTLPLEVRLASDVQYRKQVVDGVTKQDALNYRVQADRKIGLFSVTGIAQSEVYIEDESKKGTDVTPPPWKALRRVPEITAYAGRIPIPNTPLSFGVKALYGRYTEDAFRGGVRGEVTAGKGEADLTLRLDSRQILKGVSMDASARGVLDLYEGNDGRAALSCSTGVSVTAIPRTTFRLAYNYTEVAGSSPFLFDRISPQNKVTASLNSTLGPLRLTLSTGYDFFRGTYDVVSATARLDVAKGIWADATGKFDIQAGRGTALVGRVTVEPTTQFRFQAGVNWDLATGRISRVESSADIKVTDDYKLAWAAVYDLAKGGLVRGDIGITRDLHCREIALMYQYTTGRVWLEFRLKAFPGQPLGFGLGDDGILLGTQGSL